MAVPADDWIKRTKKLAFYEENSDDNNDRNVKPIWQQFGYSMCQHCSSLSSLEIQDHRNASADSRIEDSTDGLITHRGAWYGPTIRHIKAHEDSCRLCKVACQLFCGPESTYVHDACRVVLRLQPLKADGSRISLSQSHLRDDNPSGDETHKSAVWLAFDAESEPNSCRIPLIPQHGLRIQALEGSSEQARLFCLGEELSSNLQEDAPKKIREWIDHCVLPEQVHDDDNVAQMFARHTLCLSKIGMTDSSEQSLKLPSRLISVSLDQADDKVRLIEPYEDLDEEERTKVAYIALSYCWGTKPVLRLEKATLSAFKEEIPMDQVPQTIADAMEITRTCNYDYIWVDSLCIIQDDNDDWASEAMAMADIYQNAAITFAILGQRNSYSGIFHRDLVDDNLLHIPWFDHVDSEWVLNGHIAVDTALPLERSATGIVSTALQQEYRQSDWATRAWTFQEDFLSRRIVYFGQRQMYWECRGISRSEDRIDDKLCAELNALSQRASLYLSLLFEGKKYDHGLLKWMSQASLRIDTLGLIRNHELLLRYTSRHLTKPADKLVAFEGLAQAVALHLNQDFHAGVWSGKTAKSLWWHSAGEPIPRSYPYRAPSWSFASVDGVLHGDRPRHGWELDYDETGNLNMNDWGVADMKSNGLGSLLQVSFQSNNPLMSESRGVRPLSMDTTALLLRVSPSQKSCSSYPQTIRQLQDDVRLWGEDYNPWPSGQCHLLFANDPLQSKTAAVLHKCAICRVSLSKMSERQAIEHYEACESNKQAQATQHGLDKLIGVAYFDEPLAAPTQCEALLLWKTEESFVYKVNKVRPEDILSEAEMEAMERCTPANRPKGLVKAIRHVLADGRLPRSRQLVLCETASLPFKGYWSRRLFNWPLKNQLNFQSPYKRLYFMLLVEKVDGHETAAYRRVGVAMCYWIPGVLRGGGIHITDVAKKTCIRVY